MNADTSQSAHLLAAFAVCFAKAKRPSFPTPRLFSRYGKVIIRGMNSIGTMPPALKPITKWEWFMIKFAFGTKRLRGAWRVYLGLPVASIRFQDEFTKDNKNKKGTPSKHHFRLTGAKLD
jgi:hypothetical protein